MAERTWNFSLEGETHTTKLNHRYFTGKRTIFVDGKLIEKSFRLLDFGSKHIFDVANHNCLIVIKPKGNLWDYDFAVNGISAVTGKPIELFQPFPQIVALFFLFVILGVPIFSFSYVGNGSLVLMFGGLIGFIMIARDIKRSIYARVIISFGYVSLIWLLNIAFFMVWLFTLMQNL